MHEKEFSAIKEISRIWNAQNRRKGIDQDINKASDGSNNVNDNNQIIKKIARCSCNKFILSFQQRF